MSTAVKKTVMKKLVEPATTATTADASAAAVTKSKAIIPKKQPAKSVKPATAQPKAEVKPAKAEVKTAQPKAAVKAEKPAAEKSAKAEVKDAAVRTIPVAKVAVTKEKVLTPKQQLVAYLSDQGERNLTKLSLNSLVGKYYGRYPNYIEGLGLTSDEPLNLQDDTPMENFNPEYDGGEQLGKSPSPQTKSTPRINDLELRLKDLISRVEYLEAMISEDGEIVGSDGESGEDVSGSDADAE